MTETEKTLLAIARNPDAGRRAFAWGYRTGGPALWNGARYNGRWIDAARRLERAGLVTLSTVKGRTRSGQGYDLWRLTTITAA